MTRARRVLLFVSLSLVTSLILVGASTVADAAGTRNWPAYLFSPVHRSKGGSTAITPSNVGSMWRAWSFTAASISGRPNASFVASPIVYGGTVFIGSNTGVLYALRQSSGAILWTRSFGFVTQTTCASSAGIRSTVTVAPDPNTGTPTVYAVTGDAQLVALEAATGTTKWTAAIATPSTTQNDYYIWSSPTVSAGHVYIGVSSQCDHPLVQGGVKMFDRATGALQATWHSVPDGTVGGSVWSSVASDGQSVFVTTGNAGTSDGNDSNSIVRLNASTLDRLAGWQVPASEAVNDSDFGGSPTIFYRNSTEYVGACNKDGIYYVWNAQTLQLAWERTLSPGTASGINARLAAAAWDGSHLLVAAPHSTIQGTTYNGSVRMLNAADGSSIWETGLPGIVIGSPSLNSPASSPFRCTTRPAGRTGPRSSTRRTGRCFEPSRPAPCSRNPRSPGSTCSSRRRAAGWSRGGSRSVDHDEEEVRSGDRETGQPSLRDARDLVEIRVRGASSRLRCGCRFGRGEPSCHRVPR